jgi:drug/metabolite transporter (DMT)-like permease
MDSESVKDGDMNARNQYFGRVLRWLIIGCLYLVSVALFIWALVDVSVDTLGGKEEIERMRWHGLFFFAFAIGLFVGVGWLARLPIPFRRHRMLMKLFRAFCLVGLGVLIGYSFGFYGGTRYIFNGRMSTFRSYRQMMHAVRIYSSEYSNHTAVVSDMSTNQPIAKP